MQVIPKPLQAIRGLIDELQESQWIDRNQQTRKGKRGGNAQCRNQLGGISRSRIHVLDSSRRQGQKSTCPVPCPVPGRAKRAGLSKFQRLTSRDPTFLPCRGGLAPERQVGQRGVHVFRVDVIRDICLLPPAGSGRLQSAAAAGLGRAAAVSVFMITGSTRAICGSRGLSCAGGGHLEHHWQPFRLTLLVASAPAFGELP